MKHAKSSNILRPLCQTRWSLKNRVAHLTFYKLRFSHTAHKVLLFLEHVQLIAQIFWLQDSSILSSRDRDTALVHALSYVMQISNPAYAVTFDNLQTWKLALMVLLLVSTLLKCLLVAHVVYTASRSTTSDSMLLKLWRLVYRYQTRSLCFLTASFYVVLLQYALRYPLTLSTTQSTALISASIIMVILEYTLSLGIETQLGYLLPDKTFLSSKNCHPQVLVLLQKLAMHILQLCGLLPSTMSIWLLTSTNVVFTVIRLHQFYTTLPLYHYHALILQGDFLTISACLSAVYIFDALMQSADYKIQDLTFAFVTWLMLSSLAVKSSRGVIHNTLTRLLISPIIRKHDHADLLIHKVTGTLELKRNQMLPGVENDKYKLSYLLNVTQSISLSYIFAIDDFTDPTTSVDMTDKEQMSRLFITHLETLSHSPRASSSVLLKLHLAKLYAKKPQLYAKLVKTLRSIGGATWSAQHNTSSLLLHCAENRIAKIGRSSVYSRGAATRVHADHHMQLDGNNSLDLDVATYLHNRTLVDRAQQSILHQLDLRISVCSNMLNNAPNLGHIYETAQTVYATKPSIRQQLTAFADSLTEPNLESLRLCMWYYLILDYSILDHAKYKKLYQQRLIKYDKAFSHPILIPDNLYQPTNAFLIISAQGVDSGHIKYVSTAMQQICGKSTSSYIDSQFSSLFPQCMQSYYHDTFKHALDLRQGGLLDRRLRTFVAHKAGHIVEIDMCLKIHPYLTQGVHLTLFIRPLPLPGELIIVRQNGDIEAMTRDIAKLLDIRKRAGSSSPSVRLTNIRQVSKKMSSMFNRYNKIHLTQSFDSTKKPTSQPVKPREFVLDFRQGDVGYSAPAEESTPTTKLSLFSELRRTAEIPSPVHLTHVNIEAVRHHKAASIASDMQLNGGEYTFSFAFSHLLCASTPLNLIHITLHSHSNTAGLQHLVSVSDSHRIGDSQENTSFDSHRQQQQHQYQHIQRIDELDEEEPQSNHYHANVTSENIPSSDDDQKTQVIPHLLSSNTQLNEAPVSPTGSQSGVRLLSVLSYMKTETPLSAPRVTTVTSAVRNTPQDLEHQQEERHQKQQLQPGARQMSERNVSVLATINSTVSNDSSKTYRAFTMAINARSTPKSFNALCTIFYIVMIITLLGQIGLKITSDETMSALVLKKNLLNNIQFRVRYLSALEIEATGVSCYLVYHLKQSDFNGAGLDIPALLVLAKKNLSWLRYYNNLIFTDVQYLNEDLKHVIYAKDVRIFGAYNDISYTDFINVTNFEAIDTITSAFQVLVSISNFTTYAELGANISIFLRQNLPNDLLTKNQQMTDIFIDLVNIEKDRLIQVIAWCLVAPLMLLLGMVLIVSVIIRRQYIDVKNNLHAFIALSPEHVKSIEKSLISFRTRMISDKSFLDEDFAYEAPGSVNIQQGDFSRQAKKQRGRTPVYTKLRMMYLGYFRGMLIYAAIVSAIAGWNCGSAYMSTKTIYRRQDQLQFSNYISTESISTYIGYAELPLSNNTFYVGNVAPLTKVVTGIENIQNIKRSLPDMFGPTEDKYNSMIDTVLFDKYNCQLLTSTFLFYCQFLLNNGQNPNMISALTLFEDLLTDYIPYFQNNDRSMSTFDFVKSSANKFSSRAVSYFEDIVAVCGVLSQIIGDKLTLDIADASYQRNIILFIFSVFLAAVSILVWMHILVRLREGNNDFKKVLQLCPAELVLSSPLLKLFLKRTSPILQLERGKQT